MEAEQAGWDGFFLWDHVIAGVEGVPTLDVWVALTAMAMTTSRIRLGATVTPLPRRRPWKLARETVTLDHLSNGRLTLGVGLGVPEEYETFGEDSDNKVRAAKLDEGLEILTGLWSGKPFEHHGYGLPRRQSHLPAAQFAAAAHPGLGGRLVAHPGAFPPRRPLGRRHPAQAERG